MLNQLLQTELRNISNEAKSYPELKDVVEKANLRLRFLQSKRGSASKEDEMTLLINSVEVVAPFLVGCATNNPKVKSYAISGLHNIIAHQAVHPTIVSKVILALSQVLQTPPERDDSLIFIKILQCVVNLVSTDNRFYIQGEDLWKCLQIQFKLLNSKEWGSIASAGIRQSISCVFEHCKILHVAKHEAAQNPQEAHVAEKQVVGEKGDEKKPFVDNENKSLEKCKIDCSIIITDLCRIVLGEAPTKLPTESGLQKAFLMELGEDILSNFHTLFLEIPDFLPIPALFFKLIHSVMKEKKDFPSLVRVLRLLDSLLRNFPDQALENAEAVITKLVSLLETETTPVWLRACALEVLMKISTNHSLVISIFSRYDVHDNPTLSKLLRAVGKFIQLHCKKSMVWMLRPMVNDKKDRCLDLLSLNDAPLDLSEAYVISSGMRVILGVVEMIEAFCLVLKENTLSQEEKREAALIAQSSTTAIPSSTSSPLAQTQNSNSQQSLSTGTSGTPSSSRKVSFAIAPNTSTNTNASAITTNQNAATSSEVIHANTILHVANTNLFLSFEHCQKMAEIVWPSLLAFAVILGKSKEESMINVILKAYQSFTMSCGTLSLFTAQEALLSSLHNFTLVKLRKNQPYVTKKNLLAMKRMLYTAHEMGNSLQNSWSILLDSLDTMHSVLVDPQTVVIDNDVSESPLAYGKDEIQVLVSSLNAIFSTSQYLSDSVVLSLLKELNKRTTDKLFDINEKLVSLSEEQVKLHYIFGLSKIIEVIEANFSRIGDLWPVVNDLILRATGHPNEHIRLKAVSGLIKTLQLLLKRNKSKGEDTPSTSQPVSLQSSNNELLTVSSSVVEKDESVSLDLMLLSQFAKLANSTYTDVRWSIVDNLHPILQISGHNLRAEGWIHILRVIKSTVPSAPDSSPIGKHVSRAFHSLQYICNDFLAFLTVERMKELIETIGAYGLPHPAIDVNIAMNGTQGLLWNVCFFISNNLAKKIGATELSDLWIMIFQQLKSVCFSPRTDIRTTALRSMFSILSTIGISLTIDDWEQIFAILYEILDGIALKAGLASDDENNLAELQLGDENGKSVMMMVHHSRNSAAKQWSETRVIALEGSLRVFKTFIAQLPHSSSVYHWRKLMGYIILYWDNSNIEIALSAVKAVETMLLSFLNTPSTPTPTGSTPVSPLAERTMQSISSQLHANNPAGLKPEAPSTTEDSTQNIPDLEIGDFDLWDQGWSTYLMMVSTISKKEPKVTHTTVNTFCSSIQNLYSRLHKKFRPSDVVVFLSITKLLLYLPCEYYGEIGTLHRAMMKLYEGICLTWPDFIPNVFAIVLEIIASSIGFPFLQGNTTESDGDATKSPRNQNPQPNAGTGRKLSAGSPSTSAATNKVAEYFGWSPSSDSIDKNRLSLADKWLKTMQTVWESETVGETPREKVFEDCIVVLGRSIQLKFILNDTLLWALSVTLFVEVLEKGLGCFIREAESKNNLLNINIVCTDVLDSFESYLFHETNALSNEWSLLLIKGLIVVLGDTSIEIFNHSSLKNIRSRVLQMLTRVCTKEFNKEIFHLLSGFQSHHEKACDVSALLVPIIMENYRTLLANFVTQIEGKKEKASSKSSELADVLFVLTSLNDDWNRQPILMELSPLLCSCILSENIDVRTRVKVLFENYFKSTQAIPHLPNQEAAITTT